MGGSLSSRPFYGVCRRVRGCSPGTGSIPECSTRPKIHTNRKDKRMFSLGTTNKNIIQMRKQYLFGIINKWLDEDSVQDIELKEYSYEATGTSDVGGNAPS